MVASMMKELIRIQNREHLLSTLAEAAELEHNLMCLYLYAVFSLKQSENEGLTAGELRAVQAWRKKILEVSVQEMCHLALVSNMIKAVGGSPHFFRSSFPIAPGYFPSEFVIELAPFALETLEHFIFLERPEDEPVREPAAFEPAEDYARPSPRNRLMTHTGDYSTVGQLYRAIEDGFRYLAGELGEERLFCGASALQLTPTDIELVGLRTVTDTNSAIAAIQFIVEQGEGARNSVDSHFEKFTAIRDEYRSLLANNPGFEPARPALRNPAMRKPAVDSDARTWVTDPLSARVMDLGNAIYGLMLRSLTQVYFMESRPRTGKKLLLETAFSLMHALGKAGSLLTQLPVDESAQVTAGLSFGLERHFNALELKNEKALICERLEDLVAVCEELEQETRLLTVQTKAAAEITTSLRKALSRLKEAMVS
jgi:hypothetical protein